MVQALYSDFWRRWKWQNIEATKIGCLIAPPWADVAKQQTQGPIWSVRNNRISICDLVWQNRGLLTIEKPNLQSVGTYAYQSFTQFPLIPYLQDHPAYRSSFWLNQASSNMHGCMAGVEAGQINFLRQRCI